MTQIQAVYRSAADLSQKFIQEAVSGWIDTCSNSSC